MDCSKGCPLAAEIVSVPGLRVHSATPSDEGVLRVPVETTALGAAARELSR